MASSIHPSLSAFNLSGESPTRRLSFHGQVCVVSHNNRSSLKASKPLRLDGNCTRVAASRSVSQASRAAATEDVLEWVSGQAKNASCCISCWDLDRTIEFYTECLGMKLLRKRDIPEEIYTNAFLGFVPEGAHLVIELTYSYGVDAYDMGNGFGHFGIAVDDVEKTVELNRAKGGKITRESGPVKGGSTIIAFIENPDGYKFQLLQRGTSPEPSCQVMLRVGDLNQSIEFYEKEGRDKLGSFSRTKEQSLKQQRTRKDQLIKFRRKLQHCSLQQTAPLWKRKRLNKERAHCVTSFSE